MEKTMANRTDELRNISKIVHDMRPDWHTNGIMRVLEQDSRPVELLRRIAMAAAADITARGPGVIATRDEAPPLPTTDLLPPSVRQVLAAPRQPDDVAHRGAALARAELDRAKARKDADQW